MGICILVHPGSQLSRRKFHRCLPRLIQSVKTDEGLNRERIIGPSASAMAVRRSNKNVANVHFGMQLGRYWSLIWMLLFVHALKQGSVYGLKQGSVHGFARLRRSRKMQIAMASTGSRYDEGNPLQKIYNNLCIISSSPDYELAVQHPSDNTLIKNCFEEMNKLTLDDIGLTELSLRNIKNNYCLNIVCNDKFHMAVFILGKHGEIPLHDHPKMTVVSKVLYGSLDVASFTKVNSSSSDVTTVTLDYKVTRTRNDSGWLLTPNTGNIHSFSNCDALTPCVIFDILMPPYSDDADRPCNFYKISGDLCNTYYLENFPEPENLPLSVSYNGYEPKDV